MALTYDKLSDAELASGLQNLDGWSVEDGMLTKSFEFGDYASGLAFASAVGFVADRLNHHPDLFVGYRKAKVSMTTHDAGGLTGYDLELAKRIDAIP